MTCLDRSESVLQMSRAPSSLQPLLRLGWGLVGCLALTACSKQPSAAVEAPSSESAPLAGSEALPAATAGSPAAPASAQIGAPAPDFSLPDLDGNPVSLSQYRGKLVVLEWFNPGCPFVRASHTVGSLKGLADKYAAEGVVWLAINSGGPGKQGAGVEANREVLAPFGMRHPVLLDESGRVGQLYAAERTPHMYVIDADGVLVYRGAIDNSPDGEGHSPEGGKLVNYVDSAIGALRSGAKVTPSETKSYGCSVKYQDL